MNITIDDLLESIKTYNPEEIESIKKHTIILITCTKDKQDKVESLI